MIDHLYVHLDDGTDTPLLVGQAYFTARHNKLTSTTFRYDNRYLERSHAFPIDPELRLVSGPQATIASLPGAFADAAPDRWGRNLIIKRARAIAREGGLALPTLTDADFLIGVSDETRQGALRFAAEQGGPFLDPRAEVPKVIELPRLLRASDLVTEEDNFVAIKELLDAGTGSLGGARPKASVRDGAQLLIAKFPHPQDEWDVMAWEKTALDLAAAAGITAPIRRLIRVDDRAVLLLHRFDRTGDRRIPYLSAMSLLQRNDGAESDYLELAETLPEVSAATSQDLRELWRRIALSIMINNTDDHMRNHGFLRADGGWLLAPVFDINPNPNSTASRQSGIAGAYTREDAFGALLDTAAEFRLKPGEASRIASEVAGAVSRWRTVATANGISDAQLSQFADAFWTPVEP